MAFGLFKKKPDRAQVAIEAISSVLKLQLALGGANDGESVSLSDEWALGYLFGYHDGVLQAFELGDQTLEFVVMTASYQELFGSAGAHFLRKSLDSQSRQTFMKGMFAGGQEATEFISEKKPPLGLSTYLQAR